MPALEDFSVHFASSRGMRVVNDVIPSRNVIDAFYDLLPAVGWSVIQSIAPSGTIQYPLGFPTVPDATPGSGPNVTCSKMWVQVNSTVFSIYNPHNETGVSGPNCVMVPLDTTPGASLGNMASAIQGNTQYNCSVFGSIGPPSTLALVLTGKVAGADLNFPGLQADGSFGIAGVVDGGGYEFQSLAQTDGLNSAQYKVKITAKYPPLVFNVANDGRLFFDFTIFSGGAAEYALDVIPFTGPPIQQYTIVANGYQFWIGDGSPDNYPIEGRSLFASAPYIPTDYQGAFAVFVVGPHVLPSATQYTATFGAITTSLDAPPATYNNSGGFPRLMQFRSPGTIPLLTPDGKPLLQGALVMMGKNATDTPSIVGKIWDGIVSTDQVGPLGLILNGQKYQFVGFQPGASGQSRSSFLLRFT
jgi:hypothetical protein